MDKSARRTHDAREKKKQYANNGDQRERVRKRVIIMRNKIIILAAGIVRIKIQTLLRATTI